MYTMAGLLSPTDAAHLASCLTWVVVSLDAPDADTYAKEKGVPPARFDAACRGAEALAKQCGATVGISFLLHAGNWTRASEMLQLGTDLGADYVTFRPTIETMPDAPGEPSGDRSWITDAEPLLEALAEQENVEIDPDRFYAYRDWTGHGYAACLGIRLATAITADGRVWACTNRRGYEGSCLGDLRTESFEAIWARHPRQWTNFNQCRVMCRLHAVNETMAAIDQPRQHEAFI
jgi:MoaA/NifB/PqqE/SkfB family radical SAM enzyme